MEILSDRIDQMSFSTYYVLNLGSTNQLQVLLKSLFNYFTVTDKSVSWYMAHK